MKRAFARLSQLSNAILLVALSAASAWGQDLNLPTLDAARQLKHDALSVLGSVLRDPQSKETDRLSAVSGLVRNGDRDATPLLTAALLDDPSPTVRRAAAEGFARLRSAHAVPALRQAALSDPTPSIRWAAGASLVQWSLTEREFIERLLSDPHTLAAAVVSLQDAANAQDFPRALWPLTQAALILAFSDRKTYNVVERAAMLKTLGQLGTTRAIPLLRQTLNAPDEDPFVRGAAAFALGLLGADEALSDLITALQSNQDAIQLSAAGALARLGDGRALEPLSKLLRTAGSAEVRAAAASALGAFGATTIPTLAQALQTDAEPSVRQAAMGSLAQLGGSEATQAVLTFVNSGFLQSCDPSACSGLGLETLVALAQLGQGPLALHLLQLTLDALGDALPFLFIFAEAELVRVVSEVGRTAPYVFGMLLNNASPFAQALGLEALSNVQGSASRATLLRFVGPDKDGLVRRVALEGLSRWSVPDDVTIFAPELTNRDPRTREAALSALARVGDARALAPLQQALGSEAVSIRLDASGAALAFAKRIALINEMLKGCDSGARRSPDQMLFCLEE